ncbi:hypothetical protein [Nonomuraea dietziae]|uniref:hypothetical protein n=1 Tax=Nonomuraea dietziae TaxID=65515 RepID=UPI0031D6F18D
MFCGDLVGSASTVLVGSSAFSVGVGVEVGRGAAGHRLRVGRGLGVRVGPGTSVSSLSTACLRPSGSITTALSPFSSLAHSRPSLTNTSIAARPLGHLHAHGVAPAAVSQTIIAPVRWSGT